MAAPSRGPRWRARWALLAFVATAVITRTITLTLHLRGAGTSGGLIIDGLHIHHMVFGLVILAVLAFLFVLLPATGARWDQHAWPPIAFGIAWALILDESALILALRDVYWMPLGDLSYVVLGAFALLLLGAALWAPRADAE